MRGAPEFSRRGSPSCSPVRTSSKTDWISWRGKSIRRVSPGRRRWQALFFRPAAASRRAKRPEFRTTDGDPSRQCKIPGWPTASGASGCVYLPPARESAKFRPHHAETAMISSKLVTPASSFTAASSRRPGILRSRARREISPSLSPSTIRRAKGLQMTPVPCNPSPFNSFLTWRDNAHGLPRTASEY